VGAHFAYPDIDLAQYGENSAAMRDIADASSLPVLVDADDGYGNVKNVTRVMQAKRRWGPHVAKIRAACAARHDRETFNLRPNRKQSREEENHCRESGPTRGHDADRE
jgi:hypothetical protein